MIKHAQKGLRHTIFNQMTRKSVDFFQLNKELSLINKCCHEQFILHYIQLYLDYTTVVCAIVV